MLKKNAKTIQPIHHLLSERWSCRSFNPDKIVSKEHIVSLCEAARWAPSCFGDEPWRMIIFDKLSDIDAYNRALNILGEWNQQWVKNAQVIIAVLADTEFRKNSEPNRWANYDTGAAAMSICIQAVAIGMAAHQCGGFDQDKLKSEFQIPDKFVPLSMIAIGYQDYPDKLNKDLFDREIADRTRRNLGDNFFDSCWDNPIIKEDKNEL